MTFQPCPGIAQVAIQVQDQEGDIAENILHVTNGGTGEWTATDLQTLANAVDTWLTTGDGTNKFVGFLASVSTVIGIACRDLTIEAGAVYIKTVSHVGGDTDAPLQAGLTKAITLRTGLAGRSYRGRVFQPCLTTGDVSSGDVNTMDSTHLSHLQLAWNALITAISGAHSGWLWVVLSRRNNLAVRTDGVGTPIISVGVSHSNFDYQRRRAPAHARHH